MSAGPLNEIFVLGVVRVIDRKLLSSYSSSSFHPSLLVSLAAAYPAFEANLRQTKECSDSNFHFLVDDGGLLYACLSAKSYPSRLIFTLLEEIQENFAAHHTREQIDKAEEGGSKENGQFSKQDKCWLQGLAKKYREAACVDKLQSIQKKVEVS
jgi:hypothetical protein